MAQTPRPYQPATTQAIMDDADVIPLPGATSLRFFIPKRPNKRSLTAAEKEIYSHVLHRLFTLVRSHSPERDVRLKLLADITQAIVLSSPAGIESYKAIWPGLCRTY